MGIINEFFLQPIRVEQGYNFLNTFVYSIIALGLLYIIFRVLRSKNIRIDLRFFISTIPFVLFASSLRAFVDNGYVSRNFFTVSPGIYLLAASFFLLSFFVASTLFKKQKLSTFAIGIGLLTSLWLLKALELGFSNLRLFLFIFALFTLIFSLCYIFFRFSKIGWLTSKFSLAAFFSQILDATATSSIIYFAGGWEKHPLPRFFIEKFGAFSFIPLKLAVIIPVIYILSKNIEDTQLKNYFLIAIAILGIGQATRNLISLVLI